MMNDSISPPLSFEISFVSQQSQRGHACLMSAARRKETWALPLNLANGEMDQLKLEDKKNTKSCRRHMYLPARPQMEYGEEERRPSCVIGCNEPCKKPLSLSSSKLNLRSNHNINKVILDYGVLQRIKTYCCIGRNLIISLLLTSSIFNYRYREGFSATPSSSQERCYSRGIGSLARQGRVLGARDRSELNKTPPRGGFELISETKCKILFAVLLIVIIVISLPRMNPERRDDVMQSSDPG